MKKLQILALSILTTSLFAQIDLEISNGMTIETTGGLEIEISGDIIENGIGYLKGTVTSGNRSGGISSFAGLDLNGTNVDQITRTTGVDYNGATAPATLLRSYELKNSTWTTANVNFPFNSSGANDETNSLAEKYIYSDIGGTLKGYSDNNSEESLIKAASVDISGSTPTNLFVSEGVGLDAKIYLEGPYNGGTMADNLGTLPTLSPYSEAPRTAVVPSEAIDWVLLEIRSTTDASSVVGYRSAFVDANGNIINDNAGINGIGLPGVGGQDYYIVIKHRNHLPIMSNNSETFNWLTD